MIRIQPTLRLLIGLHLGLLLAGAIALSLDAPAQGWAVLVTVVVYEAALPFACSRCGRPDLAALAWFLIPVSVFQLFPDWILADLVGTLQFPHTGGVRVDDIIPLAMAGMWVAPLFAVVALGAFRPGRAAFLALVAFLGSELLAPTVGLWGPTGDTHQIFGVALYVLPAEAALGWATATAFVATRSRHLGMRIGAALAVSTFYLGALLLMHFVLDVARWRLTT